MFLAIDNKRKPGIKQHAGNKKYWSSISARPIIRFWLLLPLSWQNKTKIRFYILIVFIEIIISDEQFISFINCTIVGNIVSAARSGTRTNTRIYFNNTENVNILVLSVGKLIVQPPQKNPQRAGQYAVNSSN